MDVLKGFDGHISVTHRRTYTHKENYYAIYFFIKSSYVGTLCQENKKQLQIEIKSIFI